jgi:hypothetical protein
MCGSIYTPQDHREVACAPVDLEVIDASLQSYNMLRILSPSSSIIMFARLHYMSSTVIVSPVSTSLKLHEKYLNELATL